MMEDKAEYFGLSKSSVLCCELSGAKPDQSEAIDSNQVAGRDGLHRFGCFMLRQEASRTRYDGWLVSLSMPK